MNRGHFSRSMAGNHSLAESIEMCGATRAHGSCREIAPYHKHPLFRINVSCPEISLQNKGQGGSDERRPGAVYRGAEAVRGEGS